MKRFVPIVAVALAAVSTPAWSDEATHPVVAYREAIMEGMGAHMHASALVMKGQVDRKADLVAHAQAIHDASKLVPELFPADTAPDKTKSESKAEVWTKWEDFLKANKTLEAESLKLVEVAKTGDIDAYKAQFAKVGGSCGDCHDAFRVDD